MIATTPHVPPSPCRAHCPISPVPCCAQAREVIAINQDELGVAGDLVQHQGQLQVRAEGAGAAAGEGQKQQGQQQG